MSEQVRGRDVVVKIADSIRAWIEDGTLTPGERIPTGSELADRFNTNRTVVSRAVSGLKADGVLSGADGGTTIVRVPPPVTTRRNQSYVDEKKRALLPEDERRKFGVTEVNLGLTLESLVSNTAEYKVISPPEEIREIFDLAEGEKVLERTYRRRHVEHAGVNESISYIPYSLVRADDRLVDQHEEPWPGGTMHQLKTVGIEVCRIEDRITASMPTRWESKFYDVPSNVPIIRITKVSYDSTDRPVEVSYIPIPADRADLAYNTILPRWDDIDD